MMRLTNLIALVLLIACTEGLQADSPPAGRHSVPQLFLEVMNLHACIPIEGYFDREYVYLPPYSSMQSWRGEILLAAACEDSERGREFSIVFATLTTDQGGHLVPRMPLRLECPSKLDAASMPYGAELLTLNYEPAIQYGPPHPFAGIELAELRQFLAVDATTIEGVGAQYLCVDGNWQQSFVH